MATPRFKCRIIWIASEWLGMSYFWDLVDLFHKGSFLRLPLLVSSIIMPLVSNNLNLKLPVYVFPFLDCGAWGSGALLISWEDLDSFVFVSSGSHSSGDSRWSPTGAESSWLHQDSQGFFRWFRRWPPSGADSSWLNHDGHGGCSWLWDLVNLCTSEASLWWTSQILLF